MAEIATRRTVTLAAQRSVRLLPHATRFIIRGGNSALAAASMAFGVPFANEACRSASNAARAALWLGPDEYLLLALENESDAVTGALAQAMHGLPHSLVDVSHRQVALEVSGPHAEWLLEAQCPLPMNLRDFPVGMCTRTVFAKAEIVVWRTAPQAFHVEVWRSFSRYVAELLAAIETEMSD
jgi:sarcosine oxidase subunit gamma